MYVYERYAPELVCFIRPKQLRDWQQATPCTREKTASFFGEGGFVLRGEGGFN